MSSAIAASVEVGVFPPGWATYSAAREFGIGQSLRQPLNEKCAANCRFIPMIHERAVTPPRLDRDILFRTLTRNEGARVRWGLIETHLLQLGRACMC